MTDREALIVLPLAAIAKEPGLKRTVRAVSPTDAGRKTKPLRCSGCRHESEALRPLPVRSAGSGGPLRRLRLASSVRALRRRNGDFHDPACT